MQFNYQLHKSRKWRTLPELEKEKKRPRSLWLYNPRHSSVDTEENPQIFSQNGRQRDSNQRVIIAMYEVLYSKYTRSCILMFPVIPNWYPVLFIYLFLTIFLVYSIFSLSCFSYRHFVFVWSKTSLFFGFVF